VAGLGLAIYYTVHPGHHAPDAGSTKTAPDQSGGASSSPVPPPSGQGTQQYDEDMLAAKPMPVVDLDASQPKPVSTRNPGVIVMPTATGTGAAGVATGFPHTPEGALAQLAALDQAAMQSGTLPGVRAVIAEWAAPGGPTPQSWSGIAAM